jgi:hypothetical protein
MTRRITQILWAVALCGIIGTRAQARLRVRTTPVRSIPSQQSPALNTVALQLSPGSLSNIPTLGAPTVPSLSASNLTQAVVPTLQPLQTLRPAVAQAQTASQIPAQLAIQPALAPTQKNRSMPIASNQRPFATTLSGWRSATNRRPDGDLNRLFDGHLPDIRSAWSGLVSGERRAQRRREQLKRHADFYRTRNQLKRLKHAPRKKKEGFTFAVLGDAEPGRISFWQRIRNQPARIFAQQLRRIARQDLDFTVQLGDLVTRPTVRNFLTLFRTLRQSGLKMPLLTVIGNHDRHKPHGLTNSRIYRSLFGITNYYFDRGAARFIVIDNSNGRMSKRQLAWLDLVLQTSRHTLVFTHMPPVTSGTVALTHRFLALSEFKIGAEQFTRILAKHQAARVYFGHLHGFGMFDYLGVRYILSGGGGSPIWPAPWIEGIHHFLTVRVTPNGVRDFLHKLDGTVREIK